MLVEAISRGIEYWYANKPYCKNWWWNEIAVPRNMYRVLLLAEPGLNADTLAKGCEITSQGKTGDGRTEPCLGSGVQYRARAVWKTIHNLTGEACERMAQEIRIKASGEGIKPDFSFHQHYAQL